MAWGAVKRGGESLTGSVLFQAEGVKKEALEGVGLVFEVGAVDPDHAVVVASLHHVGKAVAEGAGGFEMTAAPAGDEVDGAVLRHRFALLQRPGAFVGMDVSVPDEVHALTVGEMASGTGEIRVFVIAFLPRGGSFDSDMIWKNFSCFPVVSPCS